MKSLIPEAPEADLQRRFAGVGRLYGAPALARFQAAHVCVIGVGGVGSWAVEALARSAIGRITMIDLDNLAESNVNRQIHALSATLGQAKVTALAQRIAQINPACEVTEIEDFVTPDNVAQMIDAQRYDYVIDAIDSVGAKTALIAHCRAHRIPLVTIGGAGGQTDPTAIGVRDMSKTEQDPLLAKVRKRLRALHGFPRGSRNSFGIDAVFSTEPLRAPQIGDECALPDGAAEGVTGLNCAGFGSSVAVTATFGLVAASHVLRRLAAQAQAAAVASGSVAASVEAPAAASAVPA